MLLLIAGPSGVGKTTITHHVEKRLGGVFSVSATTRPKTAGDVEGSDYCFTDKTQFERRRDAGEFLEWAQVFDNYYGTPRQPVERALRDGRLMILEIDVEGVIQTKQKMADAFAMFVLPPSEDVLLQRLRARQRESEAIIQKRFAEARKEITRARQCGVFDKFIVNDDLDQAVNEAQQVVQAEWDHRRKMLSRLNR